MTDAANDSLPPATPVLRGARVSLRALTVDDATAAGYLAWLSDPDVVRYTESRYTTPTLQSIRDYVQRTTADPNNVFLAILAKSETSPDAPLHIGNIKLGPIDRHHRLGDIGLLIGDKRFWGKGCATEAIALLTDYAFRQLGLHKVTASCYSLNQGSVAAFKKAGFTVEGTRPSHYLVEGTYVDSILLGRINPADERKHHVPNP